MNYSVQNGQTVYDILLTTYGRLEYVYKLIQENIFITSLDYDFNANPGAVVSWDPTFVIPPPPETDRNASTTEVTLKTIVATDGQSIYDLCLMTYGDLKYVYKLIQDNDIISLNDINLNGKNIIFNPTLIHDIGFYKFLLNEEKKINTGSKYIQGASFDDSFDDSFDNGN